MRLLFVLGMVGLLIAAGSAQAAPRLVPAGTAGPEDVPRIQVLSSDEQGIHLQFELPALALEELTVDGRRFQSLTIPNGGLAGTIGQPGIPTFTRLVAIPDEAGVTITAVPEDQEVLPGFNLMPVQSEDAPTLDFDSAAYSRDDFGSPVLAIPGDPAICRDLRVVPVTFQPLSYNPARQEIRVNSRFRVEIRFAGRNSLNARRPHLRSIAPSFDRLYRSVVLNYDGPKNGQRVEAGTWLIICADNATIISKLQPLLDWRQRMGLPVRLATMTETGSTNTAIKAFIQNAYDTWSDPPEYVVLAGDASGTSPIPTWVEDVSGYNGEGDHPYSQLEGSDILADVHIGRLSFTYSSPNFTELDVIVGKIVGYESTPYLTDPGWYTRATLVGDPSSSGYSCVQVQQWIKTRLLKMGYSQIDTVFTSPFVSQMSAGLNQGDAIFCYRGYYNMSGWTNTNTNALSNSWKMPFAVLSTCGTGSFASETSRSEQFLRAGAVGAPKAAIGAIGTATLGTHTRFNNCYTFGVFQGLLYEGQHQLGAAHTRGKMELYLNYMQSPQAVDVTIFSYWNNLMGDPATDCWTGYPNALNVSHPTSLAIGANTCGVSVTQGGIPVAGARVCLYKGTESYTIGQTDASGVCNLPISPTTAGNMLLTVTGHNCYPYLTSIPVSNSPLFVGYQACTVDDDASGQSHGNGDGQVNPGETIELRVQAKNFGTQAASAVTGALSSTDPYASVSDGQDSFGDIPAGGSAWSAGNYVFEVAPGCPNGHTFRFALELNSGANRWYSQISLSALSADLASEGTTLYNAGTNGILDPGETVGLSVKLRNNGVVGATSVTATLISQSPWITVPDSIGTFGTIGVGSLVENTADRFSVTADVSTYQGYLAAFTLVTRFSSDRVDTAYVTVPVGQLSSDDPLGPDAYGYYAFDNTDASYPEVPVYSWLEIDPAYGGNGSEVVLNDFAEYEDKSLTVPLPFNFQYYGEPFSTATICSNGWLAMGSTYLTEHRNWTIPGAGSPSNLVAVFWDDLYRDGGSHVYQKYDAANHRWIVEWSRMRNLAGGSAVTFEAILYDPLFFPSDSGDGSIVFQYNTISNVDATDGYATVGIENATHEVGLLYSYFNIYPTGAASLQAGRAIRFVPVVATPLGTLQGFVHNASNGGSALSGAQVRLLENGRTYFSGLNGQYGGGAPEGTYTIVASLEGFLPDTVGGVIVTQGQTTNQDFSLVDIAGPVISGLTQGGTTPESANPLEIRATITDNSTVATAKLFYRVSSGAWNETSMLPDASEYQGFIPPMTAGCQIDYYAWAEDGIGHASVFPAAAPAEFYTLYITEQVYAHAAEDPGDANWLLGMAGDAATTGIWVREDPVGTTYNSQDMQPEDDHTADPGAKCFVTGNGTPGGDAGAADIDGGCTSLRSPIFDLSQATQGFVTYWRWYGEGGNSTDDEFAVDVSSDGGSSWVPLERVVDNASSWQRVLVDLTSLITLTDQVVFRFQACDLNTGGIVEAAIDDFSLEVFTPDASAISETNTLQPVFGVSQNRPNPFSDGTNIGYSLERAGAVRLTVYDVQGRAIRRLVHATQTAGLHDARWDGRDDRGLLAPSGIYFYRLETDGRSEVRKLIRLE